MGEPFAGRWTLHITDNARQDTGRLDGWRLEIDPDAAPAVIEVAADVPAGGLAIPDADAAGITSTLTVAETAVVAQVQVAVDIRHSFVGDLVVELAAPSRAVAALHDRTGGGRDDLRQSYDATNAPALASFVGCPPRAPGRSAYATSPFSTPAIYRVGRCGCPPERSSPHGRRREDPSVPAYGSGGRLESADDQGTSPKMVAGSRSRSGCGGRRRPERRAGAAARVR